MVNGVMGKVSRKSWLSFASHSKRALRLPKFNHCYTIFRLTRPLRALATVGASKTRGCGRANAQSATDEGTAKAGFAMSV